jgi:hypothetical protein
MSSLIALEDLYGPEEALDQEAQERQRYEAKVAAVNVEAVLAIVTDHLRHDDLSELREYIQQTIALGEPLTYMPQPTALRMCQQLAGWVATAIDEQVQLVSLAREG